MQAFVFCVVRNKRRNKAAFSALPALKETSVPWIDEALRVLGLGWIGGLLGICGLIFGYVTYVRSRRRTTMAYVHLGEHLLGSASDTLPPLIDVLYDGIAIPRLTKSLVIIWNNGENTIAGTDIVVKDPLRLQVGTDGEILSVSVLKTSRVVNDVRIGYSESTAANEAMLTFDFLDANDGVVVEILHTSTDRKPRIKGTLRGLPKGFTNLGQFARPKPRKNARKDKVLKVVPTVSLFFACSAVLFTTMYSHSYSLSDLQESLSSGTYAAIGALAGFFCMGVIDALNSRRRYPKSLHLEALE